MTSATRDPQKVVQGIIAIHKPKDITSAGVLRTLERHFNASPIFAPWLTNERRRLIEAGANKRTINNLKIKVGHGGTLDPMATGVLPVGIGRGTKCLNRFLECTKTYECVILFGAATDTYDAVGKVVSRAPYEHITKDKLEEALKQFRGKIMQKPSVFSALKVDGKKMYEYARKGGDIPEVKARPVEVVELELVEWLEPGSHDWAWPTEEVDNVEKAGAEKLMGVRDAEEEVETDSISDAKAPRGVKRSIAEDEEDTGITISPSSKKARTDPEFTMSGALPAGTVTDSAGKDAPAETSQPTETENDTKSSPPAARLRMTVSSGFYVRSLCHDLGIALNSFGLMSSLVRSRVGDYELGKNVFEYFDFNKGEEVWGPPIVSALEDFAAKEGWETETVEPEEEWEARWAQKKEEQPVNRNNRNRWQHRRR